MRSSCPSCNASLPQGATACSRCGFLFASRARGDDDDSIPPALRADDDSIPPALRADDDSIPPALRGTHGDDEFASLPRTLPSVRAPLAPPQPKPELPQLPRARVPPGTAQRVAIPVVNIAQQPARAARSAPVAPPAPRPIPGPPLGAQHLRSQQPILPPVDTQLPGILSNSFGDMDASGAGPLDDPLQSAFAGPALKLISTPPPRQDYQPPPPQSAIVESASAARSRQLHEQAGYGDRPDNLLGTVPYFVRVMQRRHMLTQELAALTLHRKRLDMHANEALCALGEALVALQDPRMKPLSQQLQVLAKARERSDASEVAGQHAHERHSAELTRIMAELAKLDLDAGPLHKRESELQGRTDALKLQIKRRESLVRSCDTEIKAHKASSQPGADDRVTASVAEREALLAQVRSFQAQLIPGQEALGVVRREVAKHSGTISALQSEEAAAKLTMEREQRRQRASADGVRSEYREALRTFAAAAQELRLGTLASTQNDAALEAVARARKQVEAEELKRALSQSYDETAYKRGMYILVGGTTLVFLVFVGLIIF